MIAVIASMIDDEVDVTFFFRGPIALAPMRRAELEGETNNCLAGFPLRRDRRTAVHNLHVIIQVLFFDIHNARL